MSENRFGFMRLDLTEIEEDGTPLPKNQSNAPPLQGKWGGEGPCLFKNDLT